MSGSRTTERFAARGKPPYKLLVETFNLSSSYTAGGDIYNSTVLKQIERAVCLHVTPGWLKGDVVTGQISGNAFRLRLWTGASTAQPAATTDLSAFSAAVLLEGL